MSSFMVIILCTDALSVFLTYKYCHLLQIILTHEHADAVLGLDDVRVVQPFSPTNDIDPTPIYLTQHSMERYRLIIFWA